MWVWRTTCKWVSCAHPITFLHKHVLILSDEELCRLTLIWCNHDAAFTTRILTKAYNTVDITDVRRLFGFTCLEQLSHSRQTSSPVQSRMAFFT